MAPVVTAPEVILQFGAESTRDGLIFRELGIGTIGATVIPRPTK